MILITGGSGKLGAVLKKVFPDALTPTRKELDITDRDSVFKFIETNRPEKIIHAAALTGVRQCDEDKELAWKTNIRGTENLVDACLKFKPNIHFLYVSTACVFDGVKGMFTENDVPAPKNYYSLTKLLGEFVVKKLPSHLIIRTNFVAKEKWPYPKAFTDRHGTYLFADGVAKGIKDVLDEDLTGLVHITGDKKLSMLELAKLTTPDVQPITLKEYSGPPLTVDMTLDTVRWKKYKISGFKTDN